ncbi:MAG: acyltransferase [Planctomycetota bacterium]
MEAPLHETDPSPQARRLASLDVLRALAILLVLGRHWPAVGTPVPSWLFQTWKRGGWVGVDLFFVLSGFLIGGLFFREHARHGRLDPVRFLIRRGFKIYPGYYALLAFSVVTGVANAPVTVRSTLCEAFYLQNYYGGHWHHTWSLAVEEHFYLLLPALLLVLLRRRSGVPFAGIGFVAALVLGGCLVQRMALVLTSPPSVVLAPTHLRLDGLLVGVYVAYLHHRHPTWFASLRPAVRGLLGLLGALCLAPCFWFVLGRVPFVLTLGLTLNALGSALLLIAFLPSSCAGPLSRALAAVGRHSYGIYLWHMPVGLGVAALAARVTWLRPELALAVYLAGALGVGALLSRAIEAPLLRLRDRLYPSRSGILRPATGWAPEGATP